MQFAQKLLQICSGSSNAFDVYLYTFCKSIVEILSVPDVEYTEVVTQFPDIREIHSSSYIHDSILHFYTNIENIDRSSVQESDLSISYLFQIVMFEILRPIMLNDSV